MKILLITDSTGNPRSSNVQIQNSKKINRNEIYNLEASVGVESSAGAPSYFSAAAASFCSAGAASFSSTGAASFSSTGAASFTGTGLALSETTFSTSALALALFASIIALYYASWRYESRISLSNPKLGTKYPIGWVAACLPVQPALEQIGSLAKEL